MTGTRDKKKNNLVNIRECLRFAYRAKKVGPTRVCRRGLEQVGTKIRQVAGRAAETSEIAEKT